MEHCSFSTFVEARGACALMRQRWLKASCFRDVKLRHVTIVIDDTNVVKTFCAYHEGPVVLDLVLINGCVRRVHNFVNRIERTWVARKASQELQVVAIFIWCSLRVEDSFTPSTISGVLVDWASSSFHDSFLSLPDELLEGCSVMVLSVHNNERSQPKRKTVHFQISPRDLGLQSTSCTNWFRF